MAGVSLIQKIINLAAGFFAENHTHFFQNFQMMRNGRLGQRKTAGDFSDIFRLFFQKFYNFGPRVFAN